MAFELPFPPFPHDSRDVPFIAIPDDENGYTVPSSQYFKKLVGDKYLWTPVSSTDPLPVGDAAAQATLTAIQGYVDGLEAVLGTAIASPTAYTVVARLKDLATALGEVGATPTANTVLARIKTLEGYLDGVEAALGTTTDAETTGNGSVIAIVKQLRKLVTDAYATFGSAAPTKGLMIAGTDGTNARAIKTNSSGEVLTQLSGSKVEDVTFHDAAIVAADGTVFTVAGYKTLTVEIYGTSTSRTIAFVGRGAGATDRAIMGVNLSTLATATSTTGTGELWQFDITGLTSVFIDLQVVAGGNVTVKGKAVA